MSYGSCKTKGCEHHAPEGGECRYCRGRTEDAVIVAERKRQGKTLRPLLRCMMLAVKKSKQPVEKTVTRKLRPVAVEDVKVGMQTVHHGKVISAKPFHGRSLFKKGKKFGHSLKPMKGWKLILPGQGGYMLTTETGDHFYAAGSTVWTVR